MKLLKIIFITLFTTSLFAIEDIERLMAEKAESPQEKKAVYNYLISEAEQRNKLAKKFREMAKVAKGGKAATQTAHQKEMIEEADALEKLAKDYENLAQKVKQ